jgi:UDP-N-acetylglucosamine 4,6-dehydratase
MNYKNILITGGTGSFGQNFANFFLKKYPKINKFIIFSRDEAKQFEMSKKLNHPALRFFIGDVRDRQRLQRAAADVDLIIHAAALKHVAIAEYNPIEFIKTNVIGAQNIIEASIDSKVKKVIALSTDKAAAPINLYGATKLCSDKLFIAANNYSGSKVNFSVVRYGNVFGSRGSFIESNLHTDNKIISITDKEMTRFSITLNQSVNVVDWVIKNSIGGEIVIPKIPSYRILDVAKALNQKAKIKIVGLRKGEKIYEEMFSEADSYTTYSIKDFYLIISDNTQKVISKFKKKFKDFVRVEKNSNYSSKNNSSFLTINEIKRMILELKKKI